MAMGITVFKAMGITVSYCKHPVYERESYVACLDETVDRLEKAAEWFGSSASYRKLYEEAVDHYYGDHFDQSYYHLKYHGPDPVIVLVVCVVAYVLYAYFASWYRQVRSMVAAAAAAAPPLPYAEQHVALPTVDTDKEQTQIVVNMPNKTRLTVKVNLDHKVGDIRAFIFHSNTQARDFEMATAFPKKVLSDDSQTVAEAGLKRAVISVNYK